MEFTPIDDTIGVFYREVMANDAGDRYDVLVQMSRVHPSLSEEGYIMPIDIKQMPFWAGISKEIIKSPLTLGLGGTRWGVPLVFNADSFGYFPEVLGEPRPPEPVSFDLCFDNEKTLGRVGLDDSVLTLTLAGAFMKGRGLAKISHPGDMTSKECRVVAALLGACGERRPAPGR